MIKIGIIEDDHFYLKNFKEALHMTPDIMVTASASAVNPFSSKKNYNSRLDILFLDIDLPGTSGIDALPKLKNQFPNTQIIMLTCFEEKDKLINSLVRGASGYLLKDFQLSKLPGMIRTVMNGGALISPKMARWVVNYFNPKPTTQMPLSEKETKLLTLFSDGFSYEETAKALGITVDGVKYHVKKIYAKFNVNNKVEAIKKFKRIA